MVNFTRKLTAFLAAVMLTGNVSAGLPFQTAEISAAADTLSIGDDIELDGSAAEIKLTAPKLSVKTSYGKIKLTWKSVSGAEKYYVYKKEPSGTFKRVAVTKRLYYTDKDLPESVKQTYKIKAVNGTKTASSKVTAEPARMKILYLPSDTTAYTSSSKTSSVKLRSGFYTGYVDKISYSGYCVVYARGRRFLISPNNIKQAVGSYKILSCGSLSQLDGTYSKPYACGPSAAAMLFNAVTGKNITVEQAIADAKKYGVTVYGDYSFMTNGMPCKGVKELLRAELSKYGITGKSVKVFNTDGYTSPNALAADLKAHLDAGHRLLICLRDSSNNPGSRTVQGYSSDEDDATHYVVLTGYSIYSGKTYFYTANSWYYEGSAYTYASKHNNRNPSSGRYYYGLCRTGAVDLANSIISAGQETKQLARVIYIDKGKLS